MGIHPPNPAIASLLFRVQASWDEATGPPTPPSLPPGGRRVAVKVYDKLVKEFSDLTIVQVLLRDQMMQPELPRQDTSNRRWRSLKDQ